MTRFQVCVKPGEPPVLVPDRFSLGAFLFGPVWLAWHAAFLPAFAVFGIEVAAWHWLPGWLNGPVTFGLMVLSGLLARDVWLASLVRRGFALTAVVLGRGRIDALRRLLDARPDLGQSLVA